MESKICPLLASTISLLFLLLPLISQTVFAKSSLENQSPFGFLKQLEGCRKGDKVEGINGLKTYLKRFGYLSSTETNHALQEDDDYLDDLVESAIKTYQLNFNLNATGILDADTIKAMNVPRCGVPDNIEEDGKRSRFFHAVSHYELMRGRPKWPPSKTQLTYAFARGTRADAVQPVGQAFRTWASVTNFTFTMVQDYEKADLKISFQTGDHGDGSPFDGPDGVIAHSFSPTDGRFHYDGAENWAVGSKSDALDLGSIALHEIGHLLGLAHSTVKDAIMFPTFELGEVKRRLNDDDIKGIRNLYNTFA